MRIVLPTVDGIIEINRQLGGEVINRGNIEFLIAKIEAKYKDDDLKRLVARIAAIIWMDIIQLHPFSNGNKRTATEAMLLFLRKNGFTLETPTAGKVYISLKLANNEMAYEELVTWIYGRLREVAK